MNAYVLRDVTRAWWCFILRAVSGRHSASPLRHGWRRSLSIRACPYYICLYTVPAMYQLQAARAGGLFKHTPCQLPPALCFPSFPAALPTTFSSPRTACNPFNSFPFDHCLRWNTVHVPSRAITCHMLHAGRETMHRHKFLTERAAARFSYMLISWALAPRALPR